MSKEKELLKKQINEYRDLVDRKKKLESDIKYYKKEIKEYTTYLEDSQKEQEEVKSKVSEYTEKVLGKSGSENKVISVLSNRLQNAYQIEMQELFSNLNKNAIIKRFETSTKTTPIMDEFYHAKEKFLVLDPICLALDVADKKLFIAGLIVSKEADCLQIDRSCPTMTELKKVASSSLFFAHKKSASEYLFSADLSCEKDVVLKFPERIRPLTYEVLNTIVKTKNLKDGDSLAFKIPFEIGGQTFSDQTGYGSYYEGDDCISEGTLYGQVTSFYAVGIRIRKVSDMP